MAARVQAHPQQPEPQSDSPASDTANAADHGVCRASQRALQRIGYVLSNAASRVAKVTYTPDREFHPEWYTPHRERLERACALLDLIGWSQPEQSAPIQVNAREHGQAMIEALEARLIVYDDELDQDDPARTRDQLLKQHAENANRAKAIKAFTATLKELLDAADTSEPTHDGKDGPC